MMRQSVWIDDGPDGHADPDNPRVATTVEAGFQTAFILPRATITVLRGKVAAFKD